MTIDDYPDHGYLHVSVAPLLIDTERPHQFGTCFQESTWKCGGILSIDFGGVAGCCAAELPYARK